MGNTEQWGFIIGCKGCYKTQWGTIKPPHPEHDATLHSPAQSMVQLSRILAELGDYTTACPALPLPTPPPLPSRWSCSHSGTEQQQHYHAPGPNSGNAMWISDSNSLEQMQKHFGTFKSHLQIGIESRKWNFVSKDPFTKILSFHLHVIFSH